MNVQKSMPTAKKITIFLLAIIVPVSLIAGYFCLAMPQMAQAVDMPVMNNTMSGCGKMDQTEHFTAPKNASTDSIALCCVAKRENSDAGYLSFNDWAPSEASQQNVSVDIVNNNNFGNQLILENYPISPPPADLLSSVIKIE